MYTKMPFGLINVGATFQRDMDISFVGEIDRFIVIYLDDMTIFSKSNDEHQKHLRQTFSKCHKFGLYLNPKKSFFSMKKSKLLGHIVSKDGVRVDPERVTAIEKIRLSPNKKQVQSFLGNVNFLRRFVPNFAELLKPITDMLRKEVEIKWTTEVRNYFTQLKTILGASPVLVSPDYTKEFQVFSFASEHTIETVLLQKNKEDHEQPISFFSKGLRDA